MEGLFIREEKCVVSNENKKKSIGIYKQNNNFARASCFFFLHFFVVVVRLPHENY